MDIFLDPGNCDSLEAYHEELADMAKRKSVEKSELDDHVAQKYTMACLRLKYNALIVNFLERILNMAKAPTLEEIESEILAIFTAHNLRSGECLGTGPLTHAWTKNRRFEMNDLAEGLKSLVAKGLLVEKGTSFFPTDKGPVVKEPTLEECERTILDIFALENARSGHCLGAGKLVHDWARNNKFRNGDLAKGLKSLVTKGLLIEKDTSLCLTEAGFDAL